MGTGNLLGKTWQITGEWRTKKVSTPYNFLWSFPLDLGKPPPQWKKKNTMLSWTWNTSLEECCTGLSLGAGRRRKPAGCQAILRRLLYAPETLQYWDLSFQEIFSFCKSKDWFSDHSLVYIWCYERRKKLTTCTGTTVQKLSVVLTVNLSNINAWPSCARLAPPRISRGDFFLTLFFQVMCDGLSERGTTRGLN